MVVARWTKRKMRIGTMRREEDDGNMLLASSLGHSRHRGGGREEEPRWAPSMAGKVGSTLACPVAHCHCSPHRTLSSLSGDLRTRSPSVVKFMMACHPNEDGIERDSEGPPPPQQVWRFDLSPPLAMTSSIAVVVGWEYSISTTVPCGPPPPPQVVVEGLLRPRRWIRPPPSSRTTMRRSTCQRPRVN